MGSSGCGAKRIAIVRWMLKAPRNTCSVFRPVGAPVASRHRGLDQIKPRCDCNGLDEADGAQFVTRIVKI